VNRATPLRPRACIFPMQPYLNMRHNSRRLPPRVVELLNHVAVEPSVELVDAC
jgi:hypothetical protein